MPERRLPLRLYVTATVAVMAPAAVAVAVLAVFGTFEMTDLLTGSLAALIVGLFVVYFYLRDIARFSGFVDALADDREPEQPKFTAASAGDALSGAALTLAAGWRRNQSAIENLETSARAIVDGLPDPLITVDRQRRIVRANRAAAALLGEVPLGRDLSAWLRQPLLLDAVDEVLASEHADAAAAIGLELAGPPALDLAGHIRRLPVVATDGSAALIALHDVTTERRAERMRADFVANASHELKTPLASLLGFIETLRGPARDDAAAQSRFLGIMAEQAERMRRLVGDLLTLSQIEQREHTRPHGTVDIEQVLLSVRDALGPRAQAQEVSVILDIPAGMPTIEGDREEITIVFQNLLDNALKFSRRKESVVVRVRRGNEPPMLQIDVCDRGEGIAARHLPRLTERFYRVDSARSREMGGTGLGLAIVKHLVNRHRGRLTISSDLGTGSVFTVMLPVRGAETPSSHSGG